MFGHQNDEGNNQDNATMVSDELVADGTLSSGNTATTAPPGSSTPAAVADTTMTVDEPSSAPTLDSSTTSSFGTPEPISPSPSSSVPSPTSRPGSDSSDLLDLKQQALQQLSPLIDHLDQTPEEKFRTTMMMIQANDDQSLIKVAYAAAQEITDEKVRAQALLDVVNEINYFTQHNKEAAQAV